MEARWAKCFFGLTAACVLAGGVVRLLVSANNEAVFGGSAASRAFNIFAFFTVRDVIVGVTRVRIRSQGGAGV